MGGKMKNKLVSELSKKLNGERPKTSPKINKTEFFGIVREIIRFVTLLSSLMFLGYMLYFTLFGFTPLKVFGSLAAAILCYIFYVEVEKYGRA